MLKKRLKKDNKHQNWKYNYFVTFSLIIDDQYR